MAFQGFGPKALPFLKALGFHQTKEWFEANRATYESDLKTPMGDLVEDLSAAFAKAKIPLKGDRQASLFRINRDVRFAKDKSPYKTNVGAVMTRGGSKNDVRRPSTPSAVAVPSWLIGVELGDSTRGRAGPTAATERDALALPELKIDGPVATTKAATVAITTTRAPSVHRWRRAAGRRRVSMGKGWGWTQAALGTTVEKMGRTSGFRE